MATLSDGQLAQIAEKIFVMGDRAKTKLPKPTMSGPPAFKAALDPIATQADFKDAGIGVIDFTLDPKNPNVWLHNEDKAFRIGSASKIAMMLAAVQLRLDVRRIAELKIISTAAEFDALFRNRQLWKKAKPPQDQMQAIADAGSVPLISKIFDFTKDPLDFMGPDPDGVTDRANQQAIFDKLPADHELSWDKWTDFTFSERLWLTGSLSDNVAATSCVSEIGVPYVKAVQRSYGLADRAHGMHLFASSGYDTIPASSRPPAPPPPRRLTAVEPIPVQDFWLDSKGTFTDQMSWVPGSAAALTAYMIALMTNALGNDPTGDPVITLLDRTQACNTLRNNLADGGPHSIESFLVDFGIKTVPHTTIMRQLNKIGILKKSDGAKAPLVCEFVYVETKQVPAPPPPQREVMKYAVVAVGLIDDTSTPAGHNAAVKSSALGAAVHKALLTL